jgi:TetR/AcrR family transcriptional regulator, transcriptional repressor for nem operon
MPYTAEHKENTRRRIVQSARRLFNRHGFNGVSIDEIMAEAGLTRGGFYNHFGTKEELYAEVVQQVLTCREGEGASPARGRLAMEGSSSPPICRKAISRIATMVAR